MGLPLHPPPKENTRRVLLRRAHIRCGLSEVSEGRRALTESPGGTSSERFAGSGRIAPDRRHRTCLDHKEAYAQPPSWCKHRMDAKLTNFKICTTKRHHRHAILRKPDTDLAIEADYLELLVPSSQPAFADSRRRARRVFEGSVDAASSQTNGTDEAEHDGVRKCRYSHRANRRQQRPVLVAKTHAAPKDRTPPTPADRKRVHSNRESWQQTWTRKPSAAFAAVVSAATSVAAVARRKGSAPTAGSSVIPPAAAATSAVKGEDQSYRLDDKERDEGEGMPIDGESKRRTGERDASVGDEGSTGDSASDTSKDSSDSELIRDTVDMVKLAAVDSFGFRKRLRWSVLSSKPPPKSSDGNVEREGEQGRNCASAAWADDNGKGYRSNIELVDEERISLRHQPASRMVIEARAEVVALSLPPTCHPGNLQAAAVLQWKIIEAALGEEVSVLPYFLP